MQCPNCGAEVPEGTLYCEQCGEDIHMVPDFEPEVELNIEQTINGIAKDIIEDRGVSKEDTVRRDRIEKRTIIIVVAGILCVMLAIMVVLVYQKNSLSYQTANAKRCVEKEQYDKAIRYYQRALELNYNDVNILFDYAEVYFLKNNKMEYEYLLREIVKHENASDEQIESAYGKLIAIYRAREDFKSINELLLDSKDEAVIATYQNYVAMEPEFSLAEGYYTTVQPLKLSAYGNGKIYYTLDGTLPDENSELYTVPIVLEDGENTITAYFVNEFGIASEYVTKTFHIKIDRLPGPELSAMSGEYHFPLLIEVLENAENIYYTTDGSEPTEASTPYTQPIPMPLGKSTFKFVRIKNGVSSEVILRTYDLVMNTQYTPEDAVKNVVAYSLQSGKIYHEDGYAVGVPLIYKYEYQYVINIEGQDDFFIVHELSETADGVRNKTGNYFAVNAYNLKIYKLQIDEANNYTLVELEEQPYVG